MNTNYRELLNVLTVKQLKVLIRDYMNHLKIIVKKKKKDELIFNLLQHTELRNEKIVLKDNFKRDLPKPKEKTKPQPKEKTKTQQTKTQPKKKMSKKGDPIAKELCDKFDKLLEDNKEDLKFYKVNFNYYSRKKDGVASGNGDTYYQYFNYKKKRSI